MAPNKHPELIITSWDMANQILNDPKRRHGIRGLITINAKQGGHPVGVRFVQPHLKLVFDDAERTSGFFTHGYVPAKPSDIRHIVEYAKIMKTGTILIHCAQGQSRSVAAALIVLATWEGPSREKETWTRFEGILRENLLGRYRAADDIHPNRRMILLADKLLDRKGRFWNLVADKMSVREPNYGNFELD